MTLVGIKTVARLALFILVLSGAGFGLLQEARTAHADSNLVYTVDNNTAAGGVYARWEPHSADTNQIDGFGVYPGDQVQLLCGITDGDPVGQYNNTTWHFVIDLSRPNEGGFWLNDHYVDSPDQAGQLAPGETQCADESIDPMQGNGDTPPQNSTYDRKAAVDWAKAHAEDPQTNGEECTKFVSEALWAGGLPQTDEWSNNGWYPSGKPIPTIFIGTKTANAAPLLKAYLEQHYSVHWIPLHQVPASNEDLPQAEPGDIIAYSWHGDGNIDHLSFVVGDDPSDPNLPLVAEWGQFDHYGPPDYIHNPSARYVSRVWTYSFKDHMYLQQENGNQNMTAYLLHFNGGQYMPYIPGF